MKRLIIAFFVLAFPASSLFAQEENTYYVGLDIGPKFDLYHRSPNGSQPYSPNLQVHNKMAASFGVVGGILIEDRLMLETGIYKSDYRVHIDIIDQQGREFFANSPINTFTSYMIPFHFNTIRTRQGKYEPQHLILGTGFTLLAATKLGITETYFSPEVLVDPFDINQGVVSYKVTDNQFDASLVMINLNLGYQYPINDYVNINLALNGKLGVAGSNFFNLTHMTPNHTVVNKIFTKGTSLQVNIGFRYYILPDQE